MTFRFLLFSFIFFLSGILAAESAYEQAVEAYRNSDFTAAQQKLDLALQEEPDRDRSHLLYGVLLQSRGELGRAEEIMRQGVALSGPNRNELTYNLGNLYLALNRQEKAVEMFDQLMGTALEAKARLNRANSYLKLASYTEAVTDYKMYLDLDPQTEQKENIEKIIALLQGEINLQEQLAQEAAEKAAAEEAARKEAERLAAEEAARQKALLDEILASLDEAGNDSEVISAESESIETDTEESDIME